MSRKLHQVLQQSLFLAILFTFICPVIANETRQNNLKALKHIHCAVDLDMLEKILDGTSEDDKAHVFGEGIIGFEQELMPFFTDSSDFFAIKAVNLSSREHVATNAKKRYERITFGFEWHHQAQLEEIVANGYKCLKVLKTELSTIGMEADRN